MALSWSLEMAPFMATSMLPLLALPVLGVMSADDMANQYFSKPVLEKFLYFSFALVLREATLVYTRAAFFMLRRFGTRVRSLLISFLILTLVLVQVADAGLVALVLVFTAVIVISEIQNDIIREGQFKVSARVLVSKRTSGCP
ncbi:hypothetical protein IscW_ISCW003570 [Ixodes scapularis]|uniref:Uncharacterized protein n=1 Tax=Ixodes scapularis TaxID=6945 RepID=B7PHX1_IXOSC|nr:hypothetical protein IscW_ISCW003570 [Ixodes scapularis]|eukprot:XP_002403745.1 hypothetical protein IscW_ISCW003570 [Ixodes scapularis]